MLHSSPAWAVPHLQAVQPHLSSAAMLDESSLNTVLDMLVVIDSAEELALLELLTPAQKRQVWDATPEAVKARLKQIRSAYASTPAQKAIAALPVLSSDDTTLEPDENELLDAEDLSISTQTIARQKLQELEDLQPTVQNPLPKVGDRVVLLARLELSPAELKAIWEVVEVQPVHAQLKAKDLGTRRYPLNWLLIYPG